MGKVRALGFDLVTEVSFGADLVAKSYRDLLNKKEGRRYIATSCPAICGYVQKYHPEFVSYLAPIVSPMVALARAIHKIYGPETKVVFVGPCAAKKVEAVSEEVAGDVDAVLTFVELEEMLGQKAAEIENAEPSDFDPPHGADGALFPIGRGMLQAAKINEDLMTGEVVATEGRTHMLDAIREFVNGDLGARLLEILCCEGCIMGAGIDNSLPLFARRRFVREYACQRMERLDVEAWKNNCKRCETIDLSRHFLPDDQRIYAPDETQLAEVMARMGKFSEADELNCGACGYDTCREHAIAICKGMAESEMCLPYTIDQLRAAIAELEESHRELATTQEALRHSEKLASMGHLAAGVAHEVNNPLAVVLMYAHLLLDECEADSSMRADLTLIAEQADRCKKIVSGLLDFARENKVARHPTDICHLVEGAVRPLTLPDAVEIEFKHDIEDKIANIDQDQIIQAVTNLVTNAVSAMDNKGKLTVSTAGDEKSVRLSVADTGSGIPEENLKKIFEPFFTTKPIGEGTGLGLAVTYGIVKTHCGDIRVETNVDAESGPTGTTFTITLPRG